MDFRLDLKACWVELEILHAPQVEKRAAASLH